jgi:hypothetical protein
MLRTIKSLAAAGTLAALTVAGAGPANTAAAGEFAVLVHADNPAGDGDAARAQVARLFLKRASEWSYGERAYPFDRPTGSAAHKAFVATILGTDENGLEAWWLQLKQTRGETPPREVGSVRFLLRAVQRREGAFGFARTEAVQPLPDGVRILFEFDGP